MFPVLVVAVHPSTVASTRLRVTQYHERFASEGIELRTWSFFRAQDLSSWFGRSSLARAGVVLLALLRLPLVLPLVLGCRVVVVQREALPFGPPVVELAAGWRRKLVWDVDDAIWTSFESPTAGRVPRWIRAPLRKYERLCRRADEVWAGSEVLAEWCRRTSEHVVVVPTVVEVPDERPAPTRERTVGWVGSHSTTQFLEAVLPAVAAVERPPRGIVVGGAPMVPDGLDIDVLPWSLENEATALNRTRVGLYPIDASHPLADGKCGLKAILFMAQGIPPVVTPTTTNAGIVRDGVEGLHANDHAEWTRAVQRLLDDAELWERCSDAAHARARSFSVERWAPRLARRLYELGSRR